MRETSRIGWKNENQLLFLVLSVFFLIFCSPLPNTFESSDPNPSIQFRDFEETSFCEKGKRTRKKEKKKTFVPFRGYKRWRIAFHQHSKSLQNKPKATKRKRKRKKKTTFVPSVYSFFKYANLWPANWGCVITVALIFTQSSEISRCPSSETGKLSQHYEKKKIIFGYRQKCWHAKESILPLQDWTCSNRLADTWSFVFELFVSWLIFRFLTWEEKWWTLSNCPTQTDRSHFSLADCTACIQLLQETKQRNYWNKKKKKEERTQTRSFALLTNLHKPPIEASVWKLRLERT